MRHGFFSLRLGIFENTDLKDETRIFSPAARGFWNTDLTDETRIYRLRRGDFLNTDWMDCARMLFSDGKSYKNKALCGEALQALEGRHPLTQGAALGH